MNDINLQSSLSVDDNIDIKRYLSLFLSNWYLFAVALFIAFSLAYGINRYSQEVYSVSSSMLIRDDQNSGMSAIVTNLVPGGNIFKTQQNLLNEMEILKSYGLNLLVMKDLRDFHVVYYGIGRRGIVESMLYKNCPFKVIYDSLELEPKDINVGVTILDENKYKLLLDGKLNFDTVLYFGDRFSKYDFNFSLEKNNNSKAIYSKGGSNNYYFHFADPKKLANKYREKLSVSPRNKDGSVVNLTVSGFVPQQEADYLNKLMDVYIDYGLDFKKNIAKQTISFINLQLEIISDSLELAAKKMESFRLEHSFLDLKMESGIIENRLESTKEEVALAKLQKQYYLYLSEYLDERIANSTIVSPSVIGITDQWLIGLINELSFLQKEKEELGLNVEENQPAIERINNQIKRVHKALKESIKNCMVSLSIMEDEAVNRRALSETEFNRLPSIEKKYVDIQRQFDLNNTIYTYLLEKRAEAGIAQASTQPDNRPIDEAQVKGLIKPKRRNNLMIAMVLGLLIPGATIILIDFFNNKVIDKKDVEKRTKVPVIGYISHSESKIEMAVIEKPGSALSESFRSVRTAVKYYVQENEAAVIAVSSTISSEGKTFISINLASVMAMLGKKVLLVGLDLRKPRINKVLEYEDGPGMSTFLSGNCDFEEIIKKTQVNNLFYAPSGPVPPNPAELIETEFMKTFMEKVKREFNYIIIDTPPIAIVTDALLITRYTDVNLFVVRQRLTSCNTIDMIEQLKNHGEIKNMAIIINDISLSGYYGYGLRYGYMQGYGYSYGSSYYGSNYYGKYGKGDKVKGYYTEE
jgi:capsular exopolysaccharide synthesis family protein